MTPKKLRELADDTDARALKLVEAGDVRGAAALSALAEGYRAVADEQERLPTSGLRSTVKNVRAEEHRGAQSAALVNNAPMRAARASGLPSVRAVAAKLGVDATFISRVFRGKKPMPDELAERFEKLTGYPASRWKA